MTGTIQESMRYKMKRTIYVITFIVGMAVAFFGSFGSIISALKTEGEKRGHIFYDARPIHELGGIEVDSEGAIYIKTDGNIQCFDKEGRLVYGIFIGPDFFYWGIDSEKIIHTVDGYSHDRFLNGELLDSESIQDETHEMKLVEQYGLKRGNNSKVFYYGKEYYYSSRSIIVTDSAGNKEVIQLNTPTWPWSSFT